MAHDRPDRIVEEDPRTGRREVYERKDRGSGIARVFASVLGGLGLIVLLLIVLAVVLIAFIL